MNAMTFYVRFRNFVHIGGQIVSSVGPFDTQAEAYEFAESTRKWAIPPEGVSVHTMWKL